MTRLGHSADHPADPRTPPRRDFPVPGPFPLQPQAGTGRYDRPVPIPAPPLKYAQRLDDARLAEVLNERGMADLDGIREMLQAANDGGTPFCEAIVHANMVSDWDLSRVVAELFQLPFLPVNLYKPDPELWKELESPLLRESTLVPLRRFGQLLTVAMPGLVGADVLGMLAAETDYFLLPVVGTVMTNRRWIEEHSTAPAGDDWGSLFDEGDANVQASLDDFEPGEPTSEEELDLDAIEFTGEGPEADGETIEPPSLIDDLEAEPLDDAEALPRDAGPSGGGSLDLPPPPDFG